MGAVLGADEESGLKQTLGDTGGMAGSASLGLLAGGFGELANGERRPTSTPTKLRNSGATTPESPKQGAT